MPINNNRHLPAVIYVAESPEQAINYRWDSRSSKLHKNLKVLTAEEIYELGQDIPHFQLPYDLNSGDVLVRHPYNQGYLLVTDAEQEFIKASVDGIFLIAKSLCAKKVVYNDCKICESSREVNQKNELEYKVVEVSAAVDDQRKEYFLSKIIRECKFTKQELTIEQYEKAIDFAKERGLWENKDIQFLFDMRNPQQGSQMTHHKVQIEVFSSLNSALDIAFTLNVAELFKIDNNTKIVTEKKLEHTIIWDIYF